TASSSPPAGLATSAAGRAVVAFSKVGLFQALLTSRLCRTPPSVPTVISSSVLPVLLIAAAGGRAVVALVETASLQASSTKRLCCTVPSLPTASRWATPVLSTARTGGSAVSRPV